MNPEKQCAKCKEIKSLEMFSVDRSRKDGLTRRCRECNRMQCKETYRRDPETYRRRDRERVEKDPDGRKEYDRARYLANREKRLAQKKANREANKERNRAYAAAYQKANRERLGINKKRRTYKITKSKHASLISQQGEKCQCCGTAFSMILKERPCIDHCHQTGIVRGILCRQCNLLLGHAKDNAKILRALARYLERHARSGGECATG